MVKYRIIKKINRGITMNEQKARDLCMAIEPPYIDFIQQNYKTALKAMEWKEQQLIDNLREVLSAHMHGGEIDEVLAELDEKMK